nr:integrase, catalytic region, zinc finger, CCHC-type, peptidase aspartic, catalytic [Tanacetum cinerariifolium]
MAVGSRDRPPMLTPGRHPQWRSRFLRYVDTRPNGEALRKCILSGPYKPTTVLVHAVKATDDSPVVLEHTTVETPMNMSSENKAHFLEEKEAIHLILTRIGDDIYSTIDAFQTAQEIHKGKEIAKPITPPSETASEEDSDPAQAQRDKDMQKTLALIAKYFKKIYKPTNNNLRTSSNSKKKIKPKRVKDSAYHKEKMLLCKQAEQGVLLQAREAHYSYMAKIQEVPTADSGTDSETVEQVQNKAGYNVFANHLQHSKQSEYVSNTYLVETDVSNVIPDSPDMCEDDIQNEQNDVECDDERVALANLIANLKLDTKQAKFEKFKAFNDCIIDYDKLKHKLNEALGQLAHKDTVIREGLKTKAYELSVFKEKHDELMKQSHLTKSYYEGLVKQKMKRTLNVPTARENVRSKVVQQSGIQCFNCREFEHFAKECRKPKRVKDSAYHKEKMLLCKQAEQGVPLQAEQYDWIADTDEEVQNEAGYNVFANHLQHSEQSESVSNTCLVETNDSNVTLDSPDMCEDDIHNEQNDVESDDERVALANLKLNVDENKKIQKQLKKANTSLAQELKECKAILAETSKSLGSLLVSKIVAWLHFRPSRLSLRSIRHLMTIPLTMTNLNSDSLKFVHELKKEMHTDLKYVKSLEKKIDELESEKGEFSDMYDVILQECVSKDVVCSYLMPLSDLDALDELQSKLQDKNIAISELKKLIEKGKGKSVDTKFDRPFVIRQSTPQLIPKPSVLGKPTPFSTSLDRIYFQKTKSVLKVNVSEGLSKPVTAQTLPQATKKAVSNINVLKPGLYIIDNRTAHTRAPQLPQTVRNTNPRVSTSIGVNHKPTVSRPPLKSNQSKDKVLPNNSQVKAKKTQVEVHPRIPSVLNKMKVYYVQGLNHNLFSVGQFCDADLEVAFRKSTCFVRDLQGNDLLVAPSTQTNVHAEENNNDQAGEGEQLQDNEFTNPFCALT